LILVEVQIHLHEAGPFIGKVLFGEDGADGAFVHTQAAIDACVGIDVQLIGAIEFRFILGGMNAVNGTNVDAGRVLGGDAWFGNDVCHVVEIASGNTDEQRDAPPRGATKTRIGW
jgi:hypothetical protein